MKKRYIWVGLTIVILAVGAFSLWRSSGHCSEYAIGESFDISSDPSFIAYVGSYVAKHVSGGILVRNMLCRDDRGSVITSIPNAADFHPLKNTEGGSTDYYRAGDTIYTFEWVFPPPSPPIPQSMKNVDLATFVPGPVPGIPEIAKDKYHVYINGKADSVIDPATLSGISGSDTSFSDANHSYTLNQNFDGYTIEKYDLQTLVILSQIGPADDTNSSPMEGYIKDKNGVYFHEKKIPGADPVSFVALTKPKIYSQKLGSLVYSYGKDKNAVYYRGEVVRGADPATFIPLANGGYQPATTSRDESYNSDTGVYSVWYGKDATAVYEGTTTLPYSDPNTFKILWYPPYEGCAPDAYSKDATHVYYHGAIVPGADAATFVTGDTYAKDKNGYWKAGHLDPSITKPPECNYG